MTECGVQLGFPPILAIFHNEIRYKFIRRIGTASFNDGEKIGRKFASARAKGESWRKLLFGENYSLTSTCHVYNNTQK